MNAQSKLELGATATGLLNSLRIFEAAKNEYYIACERSIGEAGAEEKLVKETPIWQAAEDLIEKALMDHFRDWACEAQMRRII